jgi:acyl carrier protein
MTEAELHKTVLDTLGDIAPEADLAALPPEKDLREELDIDSMDFLNFVIALHEKLGVDIPESDYPQLATLGGAVAYLHEKLGNLRSSSTLLAADPAKG